MSARLSAGMGGRGDRARTEFENGRSVSRRIDGVTRSSSKRRPNSSRITPAADPAQSPYQAGRLEWV